MRVGVEVGGTFTDLVLTDGDRLRIAKVPSTPHAPEQGALAAIEAAGIDLAAVADLVHGSTIATNAVLERKGARVCLFVTRGTRDLLLLQRHDKRAIYDLHYRKPVPVVARRDIFELDERIAADGAIVTALDRAAAGRVIDRALADGGYDAAAVMLLNGYANPDHEREIAALIAARRPGLPVTCSHMVCGEFREYERASTTTLAAYVQPVIQTYLGQLERRLADGGFTGRFSIMQSNGGRLPGEAMGRNAITALFSGPAAGVIGAIHQARRAGFADVITLDMGGTSTDVCLVRDGTPDLAPLTRIDGLPVKMPVLDIVTVGAGGGSLVWRDDGGLLRVGPRSAGADPGPACYGRGGTRPTVTDAHLIRGSLQAESFLGGAMPVSRTAALRAFAGLADEFGLPVEAVAASAIRLAESSIVRAVEQISTARGRDPRDFALVGFGGAGPLHAARVAADLGIGTVIVPPHAGVVSAAGLLAADHVHFRSRTRRTRLDAAAMPVVREIFAALSAEVRADLRAAGVAGEPRLDHALEMRYVGQAFEIGVGLEPDSLATLDLATLVARFAEAHHRVFEFSKPPDAAVEIVSFRAGARVPPPAMPDAAADPLPARTGAVIEIVEADARHPCRRLARGEVTGDGLAGAALIEEVSATTWVPPGWRVRADRSGSLVLNREG